MKYYLVALFDDDSYEKLKPIQKKYSKKFRANRNSPIPYIALDVLENINLDKITPILQKRLSPYKYFKVECDNEVILNENLKTVSLKVENKGYINKISRNINDMLTLNGITSTPISDDCLGISLGNLNYINKDFKKNATNQSENNNDTTCYKITRFEVWKILNNRKEVSVKTFPLRVF